ncbi:MAG: hypothetical protein ACJ73E_07200 [Mycobacteriales bacterium]
MPSGTYRLVSGDEAFSCAPGPSGWRYVSSWPGGRLDLTVDGGGRQVRVELASGGWLLRGGVSGPSTVWVRSGAGSPAEERSAAAAGFAGSSPGLLLAACRLLRLSPGSRSRLRLVLVSGEALATRVVEQGWELVGVTSHPTELGPLPVGRYRVADLDTGDMGEVHVAGDVVLAAPGVQLVELSSPPSL